MVKPGPSVSVSLFVFPAARAADESARQQTTATAERIVRRKERLLSIWCSSHVPPARKLRRLRRVLTGGEHVELRRPALVEADASLARVPATARRSKILSCADREDGEVLIGRETAVGAGRDERQATFPKS